MNTLTDHYEAKKEPSDAVRAAIHTRRAERIMFQQSLVDDLDKTLLKSLREHDEARVPGEDTTLCDYVIYDRAMLTLEQTVLNELLLRYNRDGSLKEQ